jgi:hypothetical protein
MAENDGGDTGKEHDRHHDPDQHGRGAHWVYTVFFSLLFTVLDFAFLWPENHFLALAALAAALSVVMLFEAWKAGHRKLGYWGSVIFFLAAIVTYVIVVPDTEVSISLQPGNAPTPANGCDRNHAVPLGALKILIGNNALAMLNITKTTLIKNGSCESLSVTKTPSGTMTVDADLYNADGRLIMRIRDGKGTGLAGANV